MRVCFLSDTHGFHWKVVIPYSTELIIFAGDHTNFGEPELTADFNKWLGHLGIPSIVIGGNHDLNLRDDPSAPALLSNATYLLDSEVEVGGLRIYGAPWSPQLVGWTFGYPREPRSAAEEVWGRIPEGIDILVTHGPPHGVFDAHHWTKDRLGCPALRAAVARVKPKVHAFGHIHEARSRGVYSETLFINCSFTGFPRHDDFMQPTITNVTG